MPITITEDANSFSVNNPKTSLGDLTQIRSGETGAIAYLEANGRTYIKPAGSSTPILLKEAGSSDTWAARFYDDWGYGSSKLYAVESKGSGYILAIKNIWNGQTEWSTVEVSSTGVVDWSKSFWGDITSKETEFAEDLNGDSVIGIDTSSIAVKSTDAGSERLASDSSGNLYIYENYGQGNQTIISVVDKWSGGSVNLDRSSSSTGFSFQAETLAAKKSGSNFLILCKETETFTSGGSEEKNIFYNLYTVEANGSMEWETMQWNANITTIEGTFGQDFNSDGTVGFNAANLVTLSTDTHGHTQGGISVQRDSKDGAIYLYNGSSRLAVTGEGGGDPEVEVTELYQEGSFTSTVMAAEQVGSDYYLAIKNVDSFTSSTGGSSSTSTYWDVLKVNSSGEALWDESSTTASIAGYEHVFNQSLDNDTVVGIALDTLTDVTTDTTNDRLKTSNGVLFIYDDSDLSTRIPVKDTSGGYPSVYVNETWDGGSFSIAPYAVARIDAGSAGDDSSDYYRVLLKQTDSYTVAGETKNETQYMLYKVGLNGVIDMSQTIYSSSVIVYEGSIWLDQDVNGDGDKSGTVTVTPRNTDTYQTRLGDDRENALYVVDGGTNVAVLDDFIEESHSWLGGSFEASALAVEKNNNGSPSPSDDYYQLAVKQTNTWTNQSGVTQSDESYQIYAINAAGSNIGRVDWEKTIWTQSISDFETSFNMDLDSSGQIGDIPGLATATTDTTGFRLQKDNFGTIYIADASESNPLAITEEGSNGQSINFDYSSNSGTSSHQSVAVAAEKNPDNSYSLAVKHTEVNQGDTTIDWEVFTITSAGKLDKNTSIRTSDITPYETSTFLEDIDDNGQSGLNTSSFSTSATGPSGVSLMTDTSNGSRTNNSNFYILNNQNNSDASDDVYLSVTEFWGDNAHLFQTHSWDSGSSSNSREPIAVASKTYINSSNISVNGYMIALKNTNQLSGESPTVDYEIIYADSKGIIDDDLYTSASSIKGYESTFAADLDGDSAQGVVLSDLTAVSTDVTGDLLKTGGGALYIIDNGAPSVPIEVVDTSGESVDFNFTESSGSGATEHVHTSQAFAVESFTESSTDKFLLGVKHTDIYGGGSPEVSWETFKIAKNSGNKWVLDWSTGTNSKGIARKEATFNQDMNSSGGIDNLSSIVPTLVATDQGRSGVTGVILSKDTEGAYYFSKDGTNTPILDSAGGISASFDWTETFGTEKRTATAFSIEGVDANSDSNLEKYKIAVKVVTTDSIDSSTTTEFETFDVNLAGVVDWSSWAISDGKAHEDVINHDLDGDNQEFIASEAANSTVAVSTDQSGAQAYLDSDGNLYVKAASSGVKNPIYDKGKLANLSQGALPNVAVTVHAVEAIRIGNNDYYQILLKEVETVGSTTKTNYSTVNASETNYEIDWGSYVFYTNPAPLEGIHNVELDGVAGKTDLSGSVTTTPKTTDTTGAKLEISSDGSHFIKDGSTTIPIKGPNGGFVDLTFSETFEGGTATSEALAVQKVGSNYKMVVKETLTPTSGSADVNYQVYTLNAQAGFDWDDVVYRTPTELNEKEMGQDLTADGNISSGCIETKASSFTFAQDVSTGTSDGAAQKIIGNSAQSEVKSIANADSTSSDNKIEMFTEGVEGGTKTNYTLDVKVVQSASDNLLKKAISDAGLTTSGVGNSSRALTSTEVTALTGVMDFDVSIGNPKNHGKIVSMSWVLPEATNSPVYMKKDPATGKFFDFKFNDATGEGYKWDSATRTLKVYVLDNGRYDSDPDLGKVRDPGLIADRQVAPAPAPSPSPAPSPTPSSTPATTSPAPTPAPAPAPASNPKVKTQLPTTTPLPSPELPRETAGSIDLETFNPAESSPQQLRSLRSSDIASLSRKQVAQFEPSHLRKLSEKALRGFSKTQLGALNPRALKGLSNDQLAQFKPSSLSGLSANHVRKIRPQALKDLNPSQLRSFAADAISGLGSKQINKIPLKTIRAMRPSQVAELSADALTGLSSDQLRQMSSADLGSFSRRQLKSLRSDAIEGLKSKTLNGLSEQQTRSLSLNQLAAFTNKQVRKLDDDFLNALTRKQLSALPLVGRSSLRRAIEEEDSTILGSIQEVMKPSLDVNLI